MVNETEPVGTVAALWRYPVKSMKGEQLQSAEVNPGGTVGDRAYAVPVAYAARVMAVDEHGIVLELDEEGASAIAIARGGGLLLVPLLRSAR